MARQLVAHGDGLARLRRANARKRAPTRANHRALAVPPHSGPHMRGRPVRQAVARTSLTRILAARLCWMGFRPDDHRDGVWHLMVWHAALAR